MRTLKSQSPVYEEVASPIRPFSDAIRTGHAFNWKMIQVYAHVLVKLLQELRALEIQASEWTMCPPTPEQIAMAYSLLKSAKQCCVSLELPSANKQADRIKKWIDTRTCPPSEFSTLMAELRTRMNEDFEEMVFFCVSDRTRIRRFFQQCADANGIEGRLEFKRAHDLFDPIVVARFPHTAFDIEEAARCAVNLRATACVFHLMRVVEVGILALARMVGIEDPKPSWGAILGKLDKYAYHTKYEELPAKVQPHRELIRELLPTMHAIQYAWRNKVDHVENKLIPIETITEQESDEIMVAVHGFMRLLADKFPPSTA